MRLVTWNTQWCKGLDGLVSPERIVQGARSLGDFDVLCLQEIAANYPALTADSAPDQPAEIARLLPGFEVVFGPAIDEQPLGQSQRQRFGNLIASRLPILQVQHIALPSPMADTDPHLWMPRQCTVCTVAAPWGPVRVMTTHLEYHSLAHRHAQAQALRAWHAQACEQALAPKSVNQPDLGTPYQSKPLTTDAIVCGDFNFIAHSDPYFEITNRTKPHPLADAWLERHPGQPHPPTFRLFDDTYGPDAVACDFCFVSESLAKRLTAIKVDTSTQVSDHQPVYIEMA